MPQDNITSFFDYIQSLYPYGIRREADTVDSVIRQYDLVRSDIVDWYKTTLDAMSLQMSIQTGTTGLTDWESFLGIITDEELSYAERRSTILARLKGGNATISDIKKLVQDTIGGDGSNIVIYERFRDSTDIWTYEVRITVPTVLTFDEETLIENIQRIHPAHCNVVLVTIYAPDQSAIDVVESIQIGRVESFVWGDDGAYTPGSDDMIWGYEYPTLDEWWSYWS